MQDESFVERRLTIDKRGNKRRYVTARRSYGRRRFGFGRRTPNSPEECVEQAKQFIVSIRKLLRNDAWSTSHRQIFCKVLTELCRRMLPPEPAFGCSSASSFEQRAGAVLRKLFPKHEFKKVRPEWLLNDYPGRKHPAQPLELDFFCEQLMLAVEVQGQQHRFIVPAFHGRGQQARKSWWAVQQRDKTKREICKKVGVDLIEVWFDQDIEHVLSSHPLILKRLHVA
jgi:very-short-patch-repair endonuclease